ncbi:hypothetical protein EJA05_16190 [Pseudomonas oryziphila]|uniref:Uncharacterized protein n=1 Tax=Pseudomonas entomophila TaxID=312306 RepID=A0A3Q8U1C1_9PSED|nr:hypothetical protein EJA05_16190 [Pseudomonas oryziphila]
MSDWGRLAALRGQARSHRMCALLESCAVPVGAGLPAKGCNAAPVDAMAVPGLPRLWGLRPTS